MRRIQIGVLAVTLAAVTACADQQESSWYNPMTWGGSGTSETSGTTATAPSGTAAATGTTTTGTMMPGAASGLSAGERAFIIEAAQHGMAEVELGRLAEQRAANPAVREFGRTMVQDHGQANQNLQQIASRTGLMAPTSLSPAAQAARDALQQLSGPAFDRQYVQQQYAAHAAQLTMFQVAADTAQNPQLRSFAERNVPVIQRHIDTLRSIWPTAMRSGS